MYSAVNLLRLSGSHYFKIMFNSLQGGASVNHLHIHGMYSMYEKHSDNLLLESLHPDCGTVFKTADSVNPGYVIPNLLENLSTNLENIFKLVQFFEMRQIAYNMTMFYNSETLVPEAVIWPRKKLVELRDSNKFEVAASEISGHLVYKSRLDFEGADLASIECQLKNAVFGRREYGEIEEWIVSTFE